jgi:hypothetical protein
VLPSGTNSFYFTILRDPVELFSSVWDYYGFARMYNMSLEEYAAANKSLGGRFEDR